MIDIARAGLLILSFTACQAAETTWWLQSSIGVSSLRAEGVASGAVRRYEPQVSCLALINGWAWAGIAGGGGVVRVDGRHDYRAGYAWLAPAVGLRQDLAESWLDVQVLGGPGLARVDIPMLPVIRSW